MEGGTGESWLLAPYLLFPNLPIRSTTLLPVLTNKGPGPGWAERGNQVRLAWAVKTKCSKREGAEGRMGKAPAGSSEQRGHRQTGRNENGPHSHEREGGQSQHSQATAGREREASPTPSSTRPAGSRGGLGVSFTGSHRLILAGTHAQAQFQVPLKTPA